MIWYRETATASRRNRLLLSKRTFPICRLLNADDMPFRRASQGSEGSSQPLTPRRTASSRSRPGFEPFSNGFRSIMDAPLPSSCRRPSLSMLMPGAAAALAAAVNPPQDLGEQGSGHRHLGQLEDDVAAMAHDPGADLDQLLAQGRQRPMLDLLGQGQRAHEVGEVAGQRVQLEPHGVVPERVFCALLSPVPWSRCDAPSSGRANERRLSHLSPQTDRLFRLYHQHVT